MKDIDTITPDVSGEAYDAARELAESYTDLLKQRKLYQDRLGTFRHYTLSDAYYLVTQGSHQQSERVQNSGAPDPVAKAVINAENLMNRLNREMDKEYRTEVVQPYLDVCEKIHLFEVCMNRLSEEERHTADQLYVQRKPRSYIVDLQGTKITRKKLKAEIKDILTSFAEVLQKYEKYRRTGGRHMVTRPVKKIVKSIRINGG